MKPKKSIRKMKTPKGNEYPEYVHRPLRLTNDELKDPLPVIQHFFKQYPLVEFRAHLSDWLYLLFANNVHATATFFTLSEDLERFTEAVFQWVVVNGANVNGEW